jgi:Spy/CpxP family protein refolding chaperone
MINSTTILNTEDPNRNREYSQIKQRCRLKDLKFSNFTNKPQANQFISSSQFYTKLQEFKTIPKKEFIKDMNNQLEKFQTLVTKANDFIEEVQALTPEQEAQFKQVMDKALKPAELYKEVQELGCLQKEEIVKNINTQLDQIQKAVEDPSILIEKSKSLTPEQKVQLNSLLNQAKSPCQLYSKVQELGYKQTEEFRKEMNEQFDTLNSIIHHATIFYEHAKNLTPEQEVQLKKLWTKVEKKYTNEPLPNNLDEFKRFVMPDALKLYGIVTNSYSHYLMSYLTFLM